tara:strand:- start:6065 stop:6331 length:267 start_codon:yes stop_codon:yes gene_type:complete
MAFLKLPAPNVTLSGGYSGYTTTFFQQVWRDALEDGAVFAQVMDDLNSHFYGKTVGMTHEGETVLYQHDIEQWFRSSVVIRALHGRLS